MRDRNRLFTRSFVFAVSLFPLCFFNGAHAEIYAVQNADGQMRFTNSFIAKSEYRLFIANSISPISSLQKFPLPAVAKPAHKTSELIQSIAKKHGLDPALVTAIVAVESGFNSEARSSKGAIGLMQLMPATAQQYGVVNAKDPIENVSAGTRHFKNLLDRHHGNVALALAAYNAGDGTIVRNAKRIPPYPETMLYVSKVLALYERYRVDATN